MAVIEGEGVRCRWGARPGGRPRRGGGRRTAPPACAGRALALSVVGRVGVQAGGVGCRPAVLWAHAGLQAGCCAGAQIVLSTSLSVFCVVQVVCWHRILG